MDYCNLQVGGKYPPIARAGECVAVDIDESGILLIYNFMHPNQNEILAVGSSKPFEIRFVTVSDVLYILTKCGDLNWTDAPFSPHLATAPSLPEIKNNEDGYALTLMMVDAASNTIKNLRVIGLGNSFSKALKSEIDILIQKPFDQIQYASTINLNNVRYSTNDLARMAYQTRWRAR